MDRENELIDLGLVSSETKGSLVTEDDHENGFQPAFGLISD